MQKNSFVFFTKTSLERLYNVMYLERFNLSKQSQLFITNYIKNRVIFAYTYIVDLVIKKCCNKEQRKNFFNTSLQHPY